MLRSYSPFRTFSNGLIFSILTIERSKLQFSKGFENMALFGIIKSLIQLWISDKNSSFRPFSRHAC